MGRDVRGVAACPHCHNALRWGAEVRCAHCDKRFPLVDGVPVFLDAKITANARWDTGASEYFSWLLRYRRFLRPSLTKKFSTTNIVKDFTASFPPNSVIVNVGAGDKDYGVLNVDIDFGPTIDIVASAEALPFRDGSCDGHILQAVLEHVSDAEQVLVEAHRVLRPGGRLLIEVPFIQGFHAGPQDHRRYTQAGLEAELIRHGFEVEGSGVAVGPASAMAWITAEFLALLLSGRSAAAYRFARLATTWLALPIKYADVWLERHPMSFVVASGVWAEARRPHLHHRGGHRRESRTANTSDLNRLSGS
jgi:predicted SAM-dependent methyltransferase